MSCVPSDDRLCTVPISIAARLDALVDLPLLEPPTSDIPLDTRNLDGSKYVDGL